MQHLSPVSLIFFLKYLPICNYSRVVNYLNARINNAFMTDMQSVGVREPALMWNFAAPYEPIVVDYAVFAPQWVDSARSAIKRVESFATMPAIIDDFGTHAERHAWRDAQDPVRLGIITHNVLRRNHLGQFTLDALNLSLVYAGPDKETIDAAAQRIHYALPADYADLPLERKLEVAKAMQADARTFLQYFAMRNDS
jgi:hypothetical protein